MGIVYNERMRQNRRDGKKKKKEKQGAIEKGKERKYRGGWGIRKKSDIEFGMRSDNEARYVRRD